MQPQPTTLASLSQQITDVATDVLDIKLDVRDLKQRTTAVEQKAWHQTAPATAGKYAAVVSLVGVLAEVLRSHYPAIGDALQSLVKAFGVGG